MNEVQFLQRMINENPNVFDHIDGWSSHSYPNPNFSASAKNTGRGSVKTYEWELNLLKNLGVDKSLPVFITETGWAHNKNGKNGYLSPSAISERFTTVFGQLWLPDDRIVAVTPFILNYKEPPFDIFSWKGVDDQYYEFYFRIQSISKVFGSPLQKSSLNLTAILFPKVIKKNELSYGIAFATNTGQSIWERGIIESVENCFRNIKVIPIYPKRSIIISDWSCDI